MKIIKKINNNFALAQDDQGRNLVAYGKGIGFPEMPYVLDDLSKIDRTFYDVKQEHIPIIKEADEEVIRAAMEIVDYARAHIKTDISDYLYYVLIDHINFAIERYHNNLYVPMKLSKDIKYNYAAEYEVGMKSWRYLNRHFGISLPKDEGSIIAMHIVEAEQSSQKSLREVNTEEIINEVMKIVADELNKEIDSNDFNVYRFETHLMYLIQRIDDQEINSRNMELFEVVAAKSPDAYRCALKITDYLQKTLGRTINKEEMLYLMLHINRFSDRVI